MKESFFLSRLVVFHLTGAPVGKLSEHIPVKSEREEGRRCSVGMVIYLDGAPRCRYHHCLVLSRVLRTPSYKASKVTWQIQIIFSMAMAIGREVSWCNFGLSYLRRNVMTGRQVFLAEKSARLLLSPGGRVGKLTSLTMCCKCPIDSDSSTTG